MADSSGRLPESPLSVGHWTCGISVKGAGCHGRGKRASFAEFASEVTSPPSARAN